MLSNLLAEQRSPLHGLRYSRMCFSVLAPLPELVRITDSFRTALVGCYGEYLLVVVSSCRGVRIRCNTVIGSSRAGCRTKGMSIPSQQSSSEQSSLRRKKKNGRPPITMKDKTTFLRHWPKGITLVSIALLS